MGQRNQSISIFAELKRRNIFRVALLYVVAAWLILQFIVVLVQLLGVPDWVFRFLFTLLLICFPPVLIFSWICEITPQGIRREKDVEDTASITLQTGKKISRITLVLLAFAILLSLLAYFLPESTPEALPLSLMETQDM